MSGQPTIPQEPLDIELERFDVSTRTHNCFRRENICTVRQLTQLSAMEILGWQNAGRKTLAEIRLILGTLDLSLSGEMPAVEKTKRNLLRPRVVETTEVLSRANVIYLCDAARETQIQLVARLSDFHLSTRARNVLNNAKLVYVGELVQLQSYDLSRFGNSGRRTVSELSSLVEKAGLKLGTAIPDWSLDLVKNVEASLAGEWESELRRRSDQMLESIGPAPSCIEEEFRRITLAMEKGRNAEFIQKLWGWNGGHPRTLDSVGKEFGLTRERVRQIEARVVKRLKNYRFSTPYLDTSISMIRREVPALISTLGSKLRENGITHIEIHVGGLERAAEILGRKWPFEELLHGGRRFLVSASDRSSFSRVLVAIRRMTSNSGCVHLLSLAAELEYDESRISDLRAFVRSLPGIVWLDDAESWLYLADAARNRLFNLCSKVLGVCPRIRVAELRRAIARSRRLTVAPPKEILAVFVESTQLGRVEEGYVVANPAMASELDPNSIEAKFVRILDEFGPVMDGSEFAERCVSAGMNAISMYIYRVASPVISSLGKGVYCKVGVEVPPGTVEEILSRRKVTPRVSDHGWTPGGALWFGTELSRSVITTGSIVLNPFVADIVQGDWIVHVPGGRVGDPATCKGPFIWSFRRALTLLAAEPGDIIILQFNTKLQELELHVGGVELLDAMQESGELQSTPEDSS